MSDYIITGHISASGKFSAIDSAFLKPPGATELCRRSLCAKREMGGAVVAGLSVVRNNVDHVGKMQVNKQRRKETTPRWL